MECKKCGSKIYPGSEFCRGCGTSITDLKQNNLIEENDSVIDEKAAEKETPFIPKEKTKLDLNMEQNNVSVKPILEEVNPVKDENIENVSEQVLTNNEVKQEPKKKKKSALLITLLTIFIIVSLGLGIVFKLFSSPKREFNNLIDYLTNFKIESNPDYNIINNNISFSLKYPDEYETVSTLKLNLNTYVNYLKKDIKIDFDGEINEFNLKGNLIGNDYKIYFYLNDVFERYLMLDFEKANLIDSYNSLVTKDADYNKATQDVYESLMNAVGKSLKEEYFKSKLAIITDGDKKVLTKEIMFNLTPSEQIDLIEDFVNNLKNDSKFINAYKKLNPNEDIDKFFYKLLSSFDETQEEDATIAVYANIFTKELVKLKIGELDIEVNPDNLILSAANDEVYKVFYEIHENHIIIKIDSDDFMLDLNLQIQYNKEIELNIPTEENYIEAEMEDIENALTEILYMFMTDDPYSNNRLNTFGSAL